SLARTRFFSDHLLPFLRGVNRISQYFSSSLSSCPSIQPWHSAQSIAFCFEIVRTPDALLANLSQAPFEESGCFASQASNSSEVENFNTGNFADESLIEIVPSDSPTNSHSFKPYTVGQVSSGIDDDLNPMIGNSQCVPC